MKYDWTRIEQKYVTGDMSLRDLSAEEQIPMSTLSKHAKEAKFLDKRNKYRAKVAQRAVTRAGARDVKAISRIMTAAERTIRKLSKAITDETVYGYVVDVPGEKDPMTGETKAGGKDIVILDKADTKALVNLSTAIRNLAMATKVMYPDGDGTGVEADRGVLIMPEREEDDDDN